MDDITNQIRKLLEIQEQLQQKPLTLEELKEVAMSSGIEEFQWNEMQSIAQKKSKLAKEHYKVKNYYDALKEATDASLINPYLTEAILTASEAALQIYITEDKDDYLEKAEYFARKILKYSPAETEAVKILARIENFEKKENTQKKQMYIKIAAIAVLSIALVVLIMFFAQKKTSFKSNNVEKELIQKREEAKAQWAQVENVMRRRDNILPQLLVLVPEQSSVNKDEFLDNMKKLRDKLQTADFKEKVEIQYQIQNLISEFTANVKQNISGDQMELLMIQIEGTYNRIAVETKRYNEMVKEYNILLEQNKNDFPELEKLEYYQ